MRTTANETHVAPYPIQRMPWFAVAMLLPIGAIEIVTAQVDLYTGFVLYIALLLVLVVRGSLTPDPEAQRLTLALTLVPITRLLALGLPIARLPQFTWYPLMTISIWGATRLVAWKLGLPHYQNTLRLVRANLPYHLILLIGGTCLAAAPFLWFAPSSVRAIQMLPWWVLLTLFLCPGFIEELIFRGVLQSATSNFSRGWDIVYPALVFGVLSIGMVPWATVLFLVLMGVTFGVIVRLSESLLDVVFLHGLTRLVALSTLPSMPHDAGGAMMGLGQGLVGLAPAPLSPNQSAPLTTPLDSLTTIITPVPLETANGLHPTVTLVLLVLLALKELLSTNKTSAWMQRVSSGLTFAIIPLLFIFIAGFGVRLTRPTP